GLEIAPRRDPVVFPGRGDRRHWPHRPDQAWPQRAHSLRSISCRRRADRAFLGRDDQPDLPAVVLSMAVVVGLTGGIGSGKTTVADLFHARGAGVVDTDDISRRLTDPGQPAIDEIARKFGTQFVTEDG